MFKILLINPPRDHLVRLDTPKNVDLGEISSFPPIGLMYLAEALRRRDATFDVRILDAVTAGHGYEAVAAVVSEYQPDVVGLTLFTYTFYDAWRTAGEIKRTHPEIPIVVGGPHMHLFAFETLAHSCFDYGVVGDGEDVLSDLCEALSRGQKPAEARGLIFGGPGRVRGSIEPAEIVNPDAFTIPAIDLIDLSKYYSTIGKRAAVGTICTSRGCPYRCTFCQVPQRRYRMRSASAVVDEMEAYISRGVTDFFFFDDLFNITTRRAINVCREILRRDLDVSWMFRGRADQINEEMLTVAKRAGCHTISVGIEAATDEGLTEINKRLTIDQAFRSVRLIRKHGISCSTNWIVGFPHQKTHRDLDYLLSTAIKMDADHAQFSVLQCLPGSALYDQAVDEGGLDPDAWLNYVRNPVESFSPPIWEKHFTKAELFAFYEKAFRSYYLRPRVVLRELLKIRGWGELAAKARSFKVVFLNRRGLVPLTHRFRMRSFTRFSRPASA
ncbi:MAG: B12-binding domain-containing radical SAM protein [Phycisphaerae bacterium]